MPGFAANRALGGGGAPAALRAEGISTARDGTARLRMRGVTLHDATAAEIAAQAARETRSAARRSGVSLKVIREWKEGMTQEERERVIGEQKLTEEQVATLDATAHARALAEAAGDRTLTLEEEVVEINRQIEKLGEADEDEAVQMLDAELLAEEEAARAEEAARSERPKAEEAARNEGDPLPAQEKAEAGRELETLRVRAAELDDSLRRKGLRKAERAKISEELSGVQARMQELSGGNLVLFSRGEAAAGRPALSPTKAALRDRLLLKIARTAGIRVIREGTEQITASARNAEARMRRVRYSLGAAEQAAWDGALDDYEAGRLEASRSVTVLPRTPAVLQRCGAANLPLRISVGTLNKVVRGKHSVPVRELRGLLVNLDNPIAVFRSRTQADSLVVLTELRDEANGNNAVVAVRLDAKESGGHEINAIASVYGKSPYSIDGMLRDGLALYAHTQKIRAYYRTSQGLQLPPEATKRGSSPLLTQDDFTQDELGVVKVNNKILRNDAGNPDIRYSREVLKHGSPHWFAAEEGAPLGRFRDDKMGTGEGAQAFGWGHYLTNREGIAKSYAEDNARKLAQRLAHGNAQYQITRSVKKDDIDKEIARLEGLVSGYQQGRYRKQLRKADIEEAKRRISELREDNYVFGAASHAKLRSQKNNNKLRFNGYWELEIENGPVYQEIYEALKRHFRADQDFDVLNRLGSFAIRVYSDIASLRKDIEDSINTEEKILDWQFHELTDAERAKAERENAMYEEEIDKARKLEEEKYSKARSRRNLYTAEIETGEQDANLLDWTTPMTSEQEDRLFAQAERELSEGDMLNFKEAFVDGRLTAEQVHESRELKEVFGSPEGISKFLHRAGFIGHKFPANSMGRGDYSKGTNYVIYSGEDIAITDAVRWLRDGEGVVYGYWDEGRGELHLNEDFADFDTPLHEWAHVWLSWVRKADARLAERALALTKETKFYKRLRKDKGSAYAGLSDDALAEEAFAMLCGKDGGEIMAEEGVSTWTKLRRAVLNVFKAAMRTLGISEGTLSRLTFKDMQALCLRDLLDDETLSLKELRASVSAKRALEDAAIFDVFDDAANASEQAVLGDLREHISHVLSAKQMSDGEGRAVDSLTSFAAVSALGANMLVMMFPPRFPRRPATRLDKRKPAFMRGF